MEARGERVELVGFRMILSCVIVAAVGRMAALVRGRSPARTDKRVFASIIS